MKTNRDQTYPSLALLLAISLAVSGCAAYGSTNYFPPTLSGDASNEKMVGAPSDQVWDRVIPELAKHFFSFNIIDKSSGLITLDFSGDPERYIDCGTIRSEIIGSMDETTYEFSAAKANKIYELVWNGAVFTISQRMSLEGRTNIVLQELDKGNTEVTVTTRYIVSRTIIGFPFGGTDKIYFNSKGFASFPAGQDEISVTCYANGNLESEILGLVH